jgi:hypothetical protein
MLAMWPGEGTRLDDAVKIFNEHQKQNQAYLWEKNVFMMFEDIGEPHWQPEALSLFHWVLMTWQWIWI